MNRQVLMAWVLLMLSGSPAPADGPATMPDVAATAQAIAAEAVVENGAAIGRPLPLAGHWNTGHYPRAKGLDPAWQMETIARGHRVLPWFQLNAPWWQPAGEDYYLAPIRRAAELRLPICFVATQFEAGLTAMAEFLDLPPNDNPNVVGADGKVRKMLCPFGPAEHWRQVGRRWTTMPVVASLQRWYPDPPLVIFLSNNEHPRLTWKQAEESPRYIERFGKGRDDRFKRKVLADGWIERYRALQAGMRDGLTAPAWKQNAIFVGYDAFGPPHLGRWGGWEEYSLWTPGRIDPNPLAWDGASPSYYVHNWNPSTDHTVWSPQIESMNWLFMLDAALALNPKFWWEVSVWDGHEPTRQDDMRKVYARARQSYGPNRYRGFVQFGMWLLRPRVVREFRGWTDRREDMVPYFNEIMSAVDRIHTDETLRQFWRKGRLVANPAGQHPYGEKIPSEFAGLSRWFLLTTDLEPARPWKLETQITVFSLALELDERPNRRWLVFAHAPLGQRKNVRIALPDYGRVVCDVTVGGTFMLVDEKTGNARTILAD